LRDKKEKKMSVGQPTSTNHHHHHPHPFLTSKIISSTGSVSPYMVFDLLPSLDILKGGRRTNDRWEQSMRVREGGREGEGAVLLQLDIIARKISQRYIAMANNKQPIFYLTIASW
jgi:hypothetical protein